MLLKKRTYLGLKQHPEVSFEPVVGGDVARSDDCDDCDTVTTSVSTLEPMDVRSLHCTVFVWL